MKNVMVIFWGLLLLVGSVGLVTAQTSEEVISLVEQTSENISENIYQTLAKINKGEHPYKNIDNPSLYVFVLDTKLNLIAHFKTAIVGRNMKGKPDVKGKLYRDEFLAVAQKDGSGWVDYYFENPKTKKIEHKNTFVKLAEGSDGEDYLVCSGRYYDE